MLPSVLSPFRRRSLIKPWYNTNMTTLGDYLKSEGFIVNDTNVPPGRNTTWDKPKFIVVHHTAGSETTAGEANTAAYIRGGTNISPLSQLMLGVSKTVWICSQQRSGQAEPGRASHAGQGKGYGVPDNRMNEVSVGIEVQASGKKPLKDYPHYDTLIKLIASLCKRWNIKVENVIGHKEWSNTGKIDPLDNMDDIRWAVAKELTPKTEVPNTEETDMAIEYKYTGKPSTTQTLGSGYSAVTNARWTPTRSGLLTSMLYVNCSYKLKAGKETGIIRVRAVRESPNDASAYQDFTVSKNGSSFLITHTWFEKCEKGRPIHWEIKKSSDFEYVKLTTRYSKWVII
jgi:N-acetylmuramoyl-L-alanine amidase CwlA